MRSESCTFIWHPKVLMHAVLAPGSAGPQRDLPRTTLDPQLFDLHVRGPRRPPEYIRYARSFLLPKLQHRPTIPPPYSPPAPGPLCALPPRNTLNRTHLTTQYPLHTPHRYA